MNKHQTQAMMFQRIGQAGIDFIPGTKAHYSNSNFLLLSYVIEKGIFPYETGFGHNGRIRRILYGAPQDTAVCYVTNGILYPRNDILDGVLQLAFQRPWQIPFSGDGKADLSKYTGVYSGDLPFKVTCQVETSQLFAAFSGQTITLAPVKKDYFTHRAGYRFFL